MKIHLIRHADRESYASNGKDFDCQLTDTGKKQCSVLRTHVKNQLSGVEVWCSGAIRTRQTLNILAEEIEFGEISIYNEFHLCPKETYLNQIWTSSSNDDLIIIGHNFGISELVEYLTGTRLIMQTAELITIEFSATQRNEITGGSGTIIHQFYPDP